MSADSIQNLNEIKALFRCRWSELVKHNDYISQIAPFTSQVRLRHLELWKQLSAGLETGYYDFYLQLIEQEGCWQAKTGTQLPVLFGQLNSFMDLVWQALTGASFFEEHPHQLIVITRELNKVRTQAQTDLLKGYNEELQKLDLEKLKDRKILHREQLRDKFTTSHTSGSVYVTSTTRSSGEYSS